VPAVAEKPAAAVFRFLSDFKSLSKTVGACSSDGSEYV